MNRRSFLSIIPVVAVLPFLGLVKVNMPAMTKVRRKRLEPDAHEITFADTGLQKVSGAFQLRAKGNALWVESVAWQAQDGTLHSAIIRKNLPKGNGLALPVIAHAKKITFSVTCLPLACSSTLVELIG
jgi:hypothetical protein